MDAACPCACAHAGAAAAGRAPSLRSRRSRRCGLGRQPCSTGLPSNSRPAVWRLGRCRLEACCCGCAGRGKPPRTGAKPVPPPHSRARAPSRLGTRCLAR